MKVVWQMTLETYSKYIEIIRALQSAHEDQDHLVFQEQLDALRSLPNFPLGMSELDTIVPAVVTENAILGRTIIH